MSFVVAKGPAALECLAAELTPVSRFGKRIRESLEKAQRIRAHAEAPSPVRRYVRATTMVTQ